jgi:hypothetical protein
MIPFVLLAVASVAAPPSDPAPAHAAPTASQLAVHRALSARHTPGCAAADALTAEPVTDLVVIAETATSPPWASLRAAQCLVEGHAAPAQPRLEAWVTDPDRRGLGVVVLTALGRAPLEVALPVARKALAEGPDPADVRRRLLRSEVPELRALAQGVTP